MEEARKATRQVSSAEFKKVFDEGEDVVPLDVRTQREYEAVHIPGAINISRGLLEFSIWSVIPNTSEKICVYCKSGYPVQTSITDELITIIPADEQLGTAQ